MSAHRPAESGGRWLGEQVEQLAGLRNANPRDPSFKLWRQHTLTVLQRIWPGETARSEGFRRIAFSPSSPKADFRTMREWYVRGCAEATDFLSAAAAEADDVGAPQSGNISPAQQSPAGTRENESRVVEPQPPDAPATPSGGNTDFVLLDADGTAAALAPEEGGHVDDASGEQAPPTLHVERRRAPAPEAAPDLEPPKLPARNRSARPVPVANAEGAPAVPVLRVTAPARPASPPKPAKGPASSSPSRPADVPAPPASATPAGERRATPADRRAPRPGKPRRAAAQPRLKDLLGLPDFGSLAEPARPLPPAAEAPVAAALPPPAAEAPVAAAPPPPAVEAPVAAAPPPPAVEAPVAAAQPVPPAEVPTLRDEGSTDPAEAEEIAQVTADFMRNSPVLGLQGHPVQRMGDATQFLDPDAVALATLASEVGRHVGDEAERDPLRALLLDLARQVEAKAPEWASLRELVTAAMAHPELARRLMPLVLPWLGRAA